MDNQTRAMQLTFVIVNTGLYLDNFESQTNCVPSVSALNTATNPFSVKDVDTSIMRLNSRHDDIHTYHFVFSCPCFRNLLCKLKNKFISLDFPSYSKLLCKIWPTVRNWASNKISSSNYIPVMHSSNFLKLFPNLEKYLNLSHNQFPCRTYTVCFNAITFFKEPMSHINLRNSHVFCAMIDLSQACTFPPAIENKEYL